MEANKKRLSSFPTTTNLVSKQRHSVGQTSSSGNPTQPPTRGGEPNGSELGWFFLSKKMPQSRDRRPRLSAFPSISNTPLGNIPSLKRSVGRLLLLAFWRTDEGVCPYRFVSFPFKEGVSLYQREALFMARRRPLQSEKGVSSHRRNALFVSRWYYSRPSPFGEGAGVRPLLLT